MHPALRFTLLPLCLLLAACGPEPLGEEPKSLDVPTDVSARSEGPAGFFFVIDAAGPMIVLDRDPAPELGTGSVELVDPGEPETGAAWTVTRRAADLALVPDELAALAGRHVVVHGAAGELCTAAIGELELVRRTDFWEPPADGADPIASAWDSASSRVVLGGRARPLDGSCAGGSFATFADAPRPRAFAALDARDVDPSGTLAGAALSALQSSDAYAAIDTDYRASEQAPSAWEHHGGAAPTAAFFGSGARTLVGIDASVPGGCGEFGATLWALYEVSAGALELRALSPSEPFPGQVLDVDRDGRFELLAGSRLLLPAGDTVQGLDVDVPFHGCPC